MARLRPPPAALTALTALAALAALAACRGGPEATAPRSADAHPQGPPGERARDTGDEAPTAEPAPSAEPTPSPRLPPPIPEEILWVIAGGGSWPADNQVSIEADLALAVERLGADKGVLLYAGGLGTRGVQVLDRARQLDPLSALLGDLFDPRAGRHSRYRATLLAPHGPANAEALMGALGRALASPGPPLTVYLAGHGEPAARAKDTVFALWGGDALYPADLAKVLAGATRQARVVMTSCHSGAFADLVFAGADAEAGEPAPKINCGLFAATWDRPSSGCDPDPDRRHHEGYGVHFLNALAGRDRLGRALPIATVDLDGDGRISLLEAHTRARIAARGFDVPTTTSERWLRHAAPAQGPSAPVDLPAERALIAALTLERRLPTERDALEREIAANRAATAALDERLREASDAEALAVDRVGAQVLSRWPTLNDPWHADFAATLRGERDAIERFFKTSDTYLDYLDARDHVDRLSARRDELVVALAPLLRLERARDNLSLAGRLAAVKGAAWERFEALRACERGLIAPQEDPP